MVQWCASELFARYKALLQIIRWWLKGHKMTRNIYLLAKTLNCWHRKPLTDCNFGLWVLVGSLGGGGIISRGFISVPGGIRQYLTSHHQRCLHSASAGHRSVNDMRAAPGLSTCQWRSDQSVRYTRRYLPGWPRQPGRGWLSLGAANGVVDGRVTHTARRQWWTCGRQRAALWDRHSSIKLLSIHDRRCTCDTAFISL